MRTPNVRRSGWPKAEGKMHQEPREENVDGDDDVFGKGIARRGPRKARDTRSR